MQTALTNNSLERKNFKFSEFIHSDTANKLGIDNNPNLSQLTCGMKTADKAQEIRDVTDIPMLITSGFRCKDLNTAVGGSPVSKHMQFLAIDFNFKGLTPNEGVYLIKKSGVSVDKCFVERCCIHVQFCMNDADNKNFFGTAQKVDGNWIVKELE